MRLLRRKNLRGEPDITDSDLAAFAQKAQGLYLQEPVDEVATRHISMMLAEVDRPTAGHFRAPLARRLRKSLTFRVAAVTTLFIGATGGLAYAGHLPDAMQDAISSAALKAGFTIPVGDPDGSAEANSENGGSDSGKSVKDGVLDAVRQDYETGREKGDAVSDAATQNRNNQDHPNGDGLEGAATDDPPASGRPNDPQDQGPKKP